MSQTLTSESVGHSAEPPEQHPPDQLPLNHGGETKSPDTTQNSSKTTKTPPPDAPANSEPPDTNETPQPTPYDATAIESLDGLDAMRRRPGMYIGDTTSTGLTHLLWEVLDNAADEAAAGHGRTITVTFHPDGSFEVADTGRGIPTGLHDGQTTALEAVFTQLHTGAKFNDTQYQQSGGLHGLGAAVVNAFSEWLTVEVDRDRATHRLEFVERIAGHTKPRQPRQGDEAPAASPAPQTSQARSGAPDPSRFVPSQELVKVGRVPPKRTGTRVRFKPDLALFEPGSEITYQAVRNRAQQLAFLIPGLKITLTDRRGSGPIATETLVSNKGLADYVQTLAGSAEQLTKPIVVSGESELTQTIATADGTEEVTRPVHVEAALTWVAHPELLQADPTGQPDSQPAAEPSDNPSAPQADNPNPTQATPLTGTNPTLISFVNTIPTPEGGTHVEGFEQAITRAVATAITNAKPRKLRSLGAQARPTKEDVRHGLVAVVRLRQQDPQFLGQAKRALSTPQARSIVNQIVRPQLAAHLAGKAPGTAKAHIRAVLDQVADRIISRTAAASAAATQRATARLGSAALPAKLADCREHPHGELLVVEGDSAAGPAKRARDATWQAVLPLRGKIVNAVKKNSQLVLANAEASDLFKAVGAGSGPTFDITKRRYDRIVLLADADVDGNHIRCLVLTLAFQYMRPMLEDGRVYAAQPPTHAVTVGQTKRFVYSDAQLEQTVAQLRKGGNNPRVTRFKGLGEMDDDELRETTLDPRTRVLRQITFEDAAAAEAQFDLMMGPTVEPRRNFITEQSARYGHALDV